MASSSGKQPANPGNNVFGNAQKTVEGKKSAIRIFNLFQEQARSGDSPMDELVAEDVENDNLYDLADSLARWMGSVPIPQDNKTGKMIGSTSLGQYFGRIMVVLKEKFKDHEAWADDTWVSDLKSGVIKHARRREIQGEDGDYKDPNCRSLYKRVEPQLVRSTQRASDGWTELQGIDLESINGSMIRQAGRQNPENYTMRAIINVTALGIGRGGEAKFLRYDDWTWDTFFECPDTIWHQMKTTLEAPLLWAPERDAYLCDFYHSFGGFFIVENGLYRPPDMLKSKKKFVFPFLHNIKNESVTTKITKTLRHHCAEPLKESTTAKSLRRGFNTLLAQHKQVTSEEQRIRGAWSSGVTSDKYTENTPSLTLPGALAIADWPDIHAKVCPPRIECLNEFPGELDAVGRLMEKLYVINVPQFEVGGALRPFLHTVTAVVLMYHPRMEADFGGSNDMVSKVVWAAEAAKVVTDSSPPGTSANAVLHRWSQAIQNDFIERNKMTASVEDLSNSQAVHQLSIQVQDLAQMSRREEKRQMKADLVQLTDELRKSHQQQTMMLQQLLALVGKKRPLLEADDAPSSPKRQRVSESATMTAAVVGTTASLTAPTQEGIEVTEPVVTQLSTSNPLFRAGESGSSKKLLVSTLLRDLFLGGHLAGGAALTSTKLSYIPRANEHLYKGSMSLVELVLTDEQKKLLRTKKKDIESVDATALEDVLSQIDSACKQKMTELEGKSDVGRSTALMTGLGARYVAWRNNKQKATKPSTTGTLMGFVTKVKEAISPSKSRRGSSS